MEYAGLHKMGIMAYSLVLRQISLYQHEMMPLVELQKQVLFVIPFLICRVHSGLLFVVLKVSTPSSHESL